MSLRNRWLLPACVSLVYTALMMGLWADAAWSQADPSPLAPGDLKRPIFDTRTPVYNTAGQQTKSASRVVAEVDGRAVTLGDVGDAIADLPATVRSLPFADLFPTILGQLVRQQALVIRAQRQGLDEDPVVRRQVRAAGERVMANALLEHEGSAAITEAALLERYEKDIAGRPGPDTVHVRVIMVSTEAAAANIITELRNGADFAALAKRSSQDATAPAGGDAGFVTRDGLTPEVGAVVFSMPPGQVTPFPVRSVGAWFVLKVEERTHGPTPAFSVARDSLRQGMLRENVGEVVKAAMAAVTVREYDITGKETEASMSGGPHTIH